MWSSSSYSGGEGECSAPTAINTERERGRAKSFHGSVRATDNGRPSAQQGLFPCTRILSPFRLLKEAPGSAKTYRKMERHMRISIPGDMEDGTHANDKQHPDLMDCCQQTPTSLRGKLTGFFAQVRQRLPLVICSDEAERHTAELQPVAAHHITKRFRRNRSHPNGSNKKEKNAPMCVCV